MELDLQAFIRYFLVPYTEEILGNNYRKETNSQILLFLAKLSNSSNSNRYNTNNPYLSRNELREIHSYLLSLLNNEEVNDIDELLRMD